MSTAMEALATTAESLSIETVPPPQPPPHYDFQRPPYLVYTADEFTSSKEASCYLKGCKW